MPVNYKLNSRIKLESQNHTSLTFTIDGKRTAVFHAQSQSICDEICKCTTNYINIENIHKKTDISKKDLIRLKHFFLKLENNNLLDYLILLKTDEHARIVPKLSIFKNNILKDSEFLIEDNCYMFSRFSFFYQKNNSIVLENPLSSFNTVISEMLFKKLLNLTNSVTSIYDFKKEFEDCKTEIDLLLVFLIKGNIIHPVTYSEPDYLASWEPHDLFFHFKSRQGILIDNGQFGGTYRFLNTAIQPPNEFKERDSKIQIYLDKPDTNTLTDNNPSFSNVLENRRSRRMFDSKNLIMMEEIGAFLYRSIGIREVIPMKPQTAVFRPYPSAGAIHEIECYLVVNRCVNLKKGIYYYCPLEHCLDQLIIGDEYVSDMISNACVALGNSSDMAPHVLFVFTSNFQKISWKYEKMAYRSTLISLGALMQTMSLVATSMNLSSCIVGSGDSLLFAEALKLDIFKEGAIGEFALGTCIRNNE